MNTKIYVEIILLCCKEKGNQAIKKRELQAAEEGISVWFCDLLVCTDLHCDRTLHKQQFPVLNISGVQVFLNLQSVISYPLEARNGRYQTTLHRF